MSFWSDATDATPLPPTAPNLTIDTVAACVAWHRATPDAEPEVLVHTAYRDVDDSGSGPECYRQLWYAGATKWVWPDDWLPALESSTYQEVVYQEVPVGTLVIQYERDRYRGRGGKCKMTAGLVGRTAEGKGKIHWLERKILRSRPVYEVQLPDGSTVDVHRRNPPARSAPEWGRRQ